MNNNFLLLHEDFPERVLGWKSKTKKFCKISMWGRERVVAFLLSMLIFFFFVTQHGSLGVLLLQVSGGCAVVHCLGIILQVCCIFIHSWSCMPCVIVATACCHCLFFLVDLGFFTLRFFFCCH